MYMYIYKQPQYKIPTNLKLKKTQHRGERNLPYLKLGFSQLTLLRLFCVNQKKTTFFQTTLKNQTQVRKKAIQ